MKKLFLNFLTNALVICFLGSLLPIPAQAQSTEMGSLRRNIATTILWGVGGAVLGLSTLSFYGEPQEHMSNITAGLALGLIGGTIYVVSSSANSNNALAFPPHSQPQNPHQVVVAARPIWQMSWQF